MKLLVLVVIKFFFVSALFIISNGDLNLRDQNDRMMFMDEYSVWLKGIFHHGSEIGGYVVNSQWLPSNDNIPAEDSGG